jgi:hypothetical protein
MAFVDFEKPLRFGLRRSMAVNGRFRDKSENHGVPGSNPGPATIKKPVSRKNVRELEPKLFGPPERHHNQIIAGGAGDWLMRRQAPASVRPFYEMV